MRDSVENIVLERGDTEQKVVYSTIQEVRDFGLTKPENLDAIDTKDILDSEKYMIFEAILPGSAGGASGMFLGASRQDLRNFGFECENAVLKTKKFR